MVYGRDAPSLRTYEKGDAAVQAVEVSLLARDQLLRDIRDRLLQAQDYAKKYYDKNHRDISFSVGDLVWLRLHRPASSLRVPTVGKLAPKYFGPYKITECIGSVAYRLALPQGAKLHDVFHVGLLKKNYGDPPSSTPPLPPLQQGRVIPQPARVLKSARRQGELHVLVQWEGTALADASWISLTSFQENYPNFQLEDELLHEEGRDVITYRRRQRT